MPRYAALFAAALTAITLSASAQTTPTTDAALPLPIPAPAPRKVCARPVYPRLAIRNEWSGKVTIAFLIGVDGEVKDSKIVKSSGHDILDEAAREALSKCQFKPATLDGKPQEVWQPVQYVWTLE